MEKLDIYSQSDKELLISQYYKKNAELIEEIVKTEPNGVQIISDNSIIITDRNGKDIFATPYGASFASDHRTDETHLIKLYSGNVLKNPTPKHVFDVTPFLTAIISRH